MIPQSLAITQIEGPQQKEIDSRLELRLKRPGEMEAGGVGGGGEVEWGEGGGSGVIWGARGEEGCVGISLLLW